uniref:Cytochrome P450, family 46, subfamily A, polypeptide 1, tandem duplicate 4 n=1 Tax=Pygocentrus nattereri TaxID=42514 RepID=A0AAR2INE8_PYGNA
MYHQTISVWAGLLTVYLLCFAFIAFVGYCLYVRRIHKKYDHIPGPPRDNFLLGHVPTFLRETNSERVIHDKFLEWAETYGPVYRINSFHGVALVVSCPEATKEFLMSPKYSKDPFVYKRLFNLFGRRFLGNGLVTAMNHDIWYKQRRIMDPAFSSSYLRGLMGTFNERAERLMERLEEIAEERITANMHQLVNCVTLDVICKVAFGVDLDLLKNYNSPFPSAIELCLQGMVHYIRDPFFTLFPRNKKKVQEIKEAVKLLRTTGSQWINQRKSAVENGDDVPKDILTQILKTKLHHTSLQTSCFYYSCYFLGQETTANQLSFVLKETLRLYPTAPGTSRWLHEDTVISGVKVPAGCALIFSSYVSSRMEKSFKDPLKFDPDRFDPNAAKPYFCYYPFALGPRSCLGQTFSQMEAKVVLAKILQRFEFSLVPGQSFNIKDTGTLRPESGVLCKIKYCSQGKN